MQQNQFSAVSVLLKSKKFVALFFFFHFLFNPQGETSMTCIHSMCKNFL